MFNFRNLRFFLFSFMFLGSLLQAQVMRINYQEEQKSTLDARQRR